MKKNCLITQTMIARMTAMLADVPRSRVDCDLAPDPDSDRLFMHLTLDRNAFHTAFITRSDLGLSLEDFERHLEEPVKKLKALAT